MPLTRSQFAYLMRRSPGGLWFDACRAQSWDYNDADRRHQLYFDALKHQPRHRQTIADGRPIRLADFDNADFDLVKARLRLLADNLRGALEDSNPAPGRARRLRYRIDTLVRWLAANGHPTVLDTILHDRFHAASIDDLNADPRLTPLPDGSVHEAPSDLDCLLMTLSRLVNGRNGYRAQAARSRPAHSAGVSTPCDDPF